MELSERKQAILEAIVRAYIDTGEPIGSKILTSLIENAPSSATLRNEMSELCELGFLEQPHISAGRVPTNNAYRFFVQSLIRPKELTENVKDYVDLVFLRAPNDPESLTLVAAKVLTELTGLTAFAYNTVGAEALLKRIELLKLSRRSVMVFLITSDGRSKSCMCRLQNELSESLEDLLESIFDKKLKRKPLGELNKAYLQNVIASAGFDAFAIMPLITAIFDMAGEMAQSRVQSSGEAAMYNIFSENKASRIIPLVNSADTLMNVCKTEQDGTTVIFGDDTGITDFKNTAVVVTEFYTDNHPCGKIGIIGSDRMSYEEIIPSVEYIASKITKIMTEVQKDMED